MKDESAVAPEAFPWRDLASTIAKGVFMVAAIMGGLWMVLAATPWAWRAGVRSVAHWRCPGTLGDKLQAAEPLVDPRVDHCAFGVAPGGFDACFVDETDPDGRRIQKVFQLDCEALFTGHDPQVH